MSKIRKRVYSYLTILSILVFGILSIRPIVSNMDKYNQSFTNLPIGTRLPLVCSLLLSDKEYINCPNTCWIDDISKINILYKFGIDYWSIKTYECKLKISKNINREILPKNESLILNGQFLTEIEDGRIVHTIYLSNPPEIESIICTSYTDHYTGWWGFMCWIFERNYPKSMTVKEFNRAVTCCSKLIYPN